ncbi:hypothetical protein [Algoriphagus vanfongensis]|nr:hypothetical protein [Algoriphagus vanfongensis]
MERIFGKGGAGSLEVGGLEDRRPETEDGRSMVSDQLSLVRQF